MLNISPVAQRAAPSQATAEPAAPVQQLASAEQKTERAVKFRRQQRWVFYVIFSLLFLGAVGMIVKVYNDNSQLLANVNTINSEMQQQKTALDSAQQTLTAKEQALLSSDASLQEVQVQLAQKTEDWQAASQALDQTKLDLEKTSTTLKAAEANVANLILELAVKLDAATMQKIPLADSSVDGLDSDNDGLPDDMETALGTDAAKSDSDDDGYSDKQELLGNFNPLGTGNLKIDSKVANQYKGKVVLQDNALAWYVGQNGKKYFLGKLTDNFSAMRLNQYWSRSN